MSFYWSDYLALAQELATPGQPISEEARFRSAISRAYYAAFHEAKDYLYSHGDMGIPLDGEVHVYVAGKFKLDTDPVVRQIGLDLARLRLDRNVADYTRPQAGIAAMTQVTLARALSTVIAISLLP